MAREMVKVNREKFKTALNDTGLTRREIAELAGVKPYVLEHATAPSMGRINLESLEKLCKAIDAKAQDYILGRVEPPAPRTHKCDIAAIDSDAIRKLIAIEGRTVAEVGKSIGCLSYSFSTMLRRGNMSVEKLKKLAIELDTTPAALLKADVAMPKEIEKDFHVHEATLTDGEDTMTLQFTEREFERIVALTKHFKLNRTTDLFHKLLDDAWRVYRTEKMKNELANMSEPELEHMFTKLAMGTRNYTRDDLIRKIVRETFGKEN